MSVRVVVILIGLEVVAVAALCYVAYLFRVVKNRSVSGDRLTAIEERLTRVEEECS